MILPFLNSFALMMVEVSKKKKKRNSVSKHGQMDRGHFEITVIILLMQGTPRV